MSALTASAPVANDVGRKNEPTRHAWVEHALTRIAAGGRILDAGAGQQQYREFCSHLDYVSQDFAQYTGDTESAGLHNVGWDTSRTDIICDITAIPEPDGSFDAVLCTEVLEHVPDPVAALKELSRLVRRGGRLIVTAPFCSITHMAPYHYSTGFSRYFYREHLPKLGWEILEISENGNFFEYLAQETRRLRGVCKRYAGGGLRDDELVAVDTLLTALRRLSAADRGSSELLCFGCHVLAQKQG